MDSLSDRWFEYIFKKLIINIIIILFYLSIYTNDCSNSSPTFLNITYLIKKWVESITICSIDCVNMMQFIITVTFITNNSLSHCFFEWQSDKMEIRDDFSTILWSHISMSSSIIGLMLTCYVSISIQHNNILSR